MYSVIYAECENDSRCIARHAVLFRAPFSLSHALRALLHLRQVPQCLLRLLSLLLDPLGLCHTRGEILTTVKHYEMWIYRLILVWHYHEYEMCTNCVHFNTIILMILDTDMWWIEIYIWSGPSLRAPGPFAFQQFPFLFLRLWPDMCKTVQAGFYNKFE